MTDSPSSILLTREQSTGSNTNLWGGYLVTTQRQTEQAMKGYQTLAVTGDATITWTNYTTGNTGQCAFLKLTGTLTSAATLTFPAYMNDLVVWNAAGAAVTIKCSGGTGVAIPNNRKTRIFCDASDYYSSVPSWNTDTLTLTNGGDLVNYTTLQTALSTLVAGSVTGLVLNSAADTTAGYLASKTTVTLSTATTTQLAGLTSVQLGTVNGGANEQLNFTVGAGYVGGFLNGGEKTTGFIPTQGTAYDVNCISNIVTVSLSGMTSVQLGQEIKLNKFGSFGMLLAGTVNGLTNLTVSTNSNEEYRYSGSTWGWN